MLAAAGKRSALNILATDADASALDVAREGIYPPAENPTFRLHGSLRYANGEPRLARGAGVARDDPIGAMADANEPYKPAAVDIGADLQRY